MTKNYYKNLRAKAGNKDDEESTVDTKTRLLNYMNSEQYKTDKKIQDYKNQQWADYVKKRQADYVEKNRQQEAIDAALSRVTGKSVIDANNALVLGQSKSVGTGEVLDTKYTTTQTKAGVNTNNMINTAAMSASAQKEEKDAAKKARSTKSSVDAANALVLGLVKTNGSGTVKDPSTATTLEEEKEIQNENMQNKAASANAMQMLEKYETRQKENAAAEAEKKANEEAEKLKYEQMKSDRPYYDEITSDEEADASRIADSWATDWDDNIYNLYKDYVTTGNKDSLDELEENNYQQFAVDGFANNVRTFAKKYGMHISDAFDLIAKFKDYQGYKEYYSNQELQNTVAEAETEMESGDKNEEYYLTATSDDNDVSKRWWNAYSQGKNENPGDFFNTVSSDPKSFLYNNFASHETFDMTPKELATYNYLFYNKGKEVADEYYNSLDLESRYTQNTQAAISDFTDKNPVLASAMSVIDTFGEPIALAQNIGEYVATGDINKAHGLNIISEGKNTTRNEVNNNIEKSIDRSSIPDDAKYYAKMGAKLLYNTGMSMADNMMQKAASGGQEGVMLAMMGTSVAQNVMLEKMDEGEDADRAFVYGLVAGGVEVLTEKVPIDNLWKMMKAKNVNTIKETLKAYGKQFLTEGSEEVASDWLDEIADALINGDYSEFHKAYEEYIAQGMSEGDAFSKAIANRMKETALGNIESFISGGLSGVGLAEISGNIHGGQSIARSIINSSNINQAASDVVSTGNTDELLKAAKNAKEGTEVRAIADQVEKEQSKAAEKQTEAAEESTEKNESGVKIDEETAKKIINAAVEEGNEDVLDVANDSMRYSKVKKQIEKTNQKYAKVQVQRENVTETGAKASDVEQIRKNRDGSYTLKMKNGTEEKANTASFKSNDDMNIVNSALRFADNTERVNAYLKGYDGNMSAEEYDTAFDTIVKGAKAGMSISAIAHSENVNQEIMRQVSQDSFATIYKYGEDLEKAAIELANSKEQIWLTKKLTEVTGSDVVYGGLEFAKGNKHASDNGYYDAETNTIHISDRATNPLTVVFAHEFLHSVKRTNADLYQKLYDSSLGFFERTNKAEYDRLRAEKYAEYADEIKAWRKQGKSQTEIDELVNEEIVANMTEALVEKMAGMNKEELRDYIEGMSSDDRTFIQRVVDSIKEFVKNLAEKMTGYTAKSSEARIWNKSEANREQLKNFLNVYMDVMKEIGQKNAEEGKTGTFIESRSEKRAAESENEMKQKKAVYTDDEYVEFAREVIEEGPVKTIKSILETDNGTPAEWINAIEKYIRKETGVETGDIEVKNPYLGDLKITKSGIKHTVIKGNYSDKQSTQALVTVCEKGLPLYQFDKWKGADYNTAALIGKIRMDDGIRYLIVLLKQRVYKNRPEVIDSQGLDIYQVIEIKGSDMSYGNGNSQTTESDETLPLEDIIVEYLKNVNESNYRRMIDKLEKKSEIERSTRKEFVEKRALSREERSKKKNRKKKPYDNSEKDQAENKIEMKSKKIGESFDFTEEERESFKLRDNGVLAITDTKYISNDLWDLMYKLFKRYGYGFESAKSVQKYYTDMLEQVPGNNGLGLPGELQKAFSEMLGYSGKEEKGTEDHTKEYSETAKKAEKEFGVTNDFRKAAYIDVNGKLLDFSEGQRTRTMDHRSISSVLDLPEDAGYSDGLIEFMNEGNIRMQSYGIDISEMPNENQIRVLKEFIRSLNGEFTLDISDESGHTLGSAEYNKGTSPERIVNDIKGFFEDGDIPQGNAESVTRFLSKKDTSTSAAFNAIYDEAEKKSVRSIARSVMNDWGSTADREDITQAVAAAYTMMRTESADKVKEFIRNKIVDPVTDSATQTKLGDKDTRKALRDYFRTKQIRLTENQKREIRHNFDSLANFTKVMSQEAGVGIVRFSDSGSVTLDEMWSEINEMVGNKYLDIADADEPQAVMLMFNDVRDQTSKRQVSEQERAEVTKYLYDTIKDMDNKQNGLTYILKEGFNAKEAGQVNEERVRAIAHDIIREYASSYNEEEFADNLVSMFNRINERGTEANYKDFLEIGFQLVNPMLQKSPKLDRKNYPTEQMFTVALEIYQKYFEAAGELKAATKVGNIGDRIKQRYEEQIARLKEGQRKTELKEAIYTKKGRLDRMLDNPRKGSHIPTELVKSAVRIAEAINTENNRMSWRTVDKQAHLRERYSELKGKDFYKDIYDENLEQMIERLDTTFEGKTLNQLNETDLQYVDQVLNAILTQVRNENKLITVNRKETIDEFSVKGVSEIRASRGFNKKNPISKLFNTYQDVALDLERILNRSFGYVKNSVGNMMARILQKAEEKFYTLVQASEDIFKNVLGPENRKNLFNLQGKKSNGTGLDEKALVTLPDSDEKITKAMRLSLIMDLKNTDSLRHIAYGGFTLPDMDEIAAGNIGEAYATGVGHNYMPKFFTEEDVEEAKRQLDDLEVAEDYVDKKTGESFSRAVPNKNNELYKEYMKAQAERDRVAPTSERYAGLAEAADIAWNRYQNAVRDAHNYLDSVIATKAEEYLKELESGLSEYEKEFLKAAEEFFWNYSGEQINKVTQKMYGYDKATIKHYFPISVDKGSLELDSEGIKRDGTLEGWSALKDRVQSKKPILLDDISRVVTRHIAGTARFCGWAEGIRDVKALYRNSAAGVSIEGAINSKWTTKATKYIQQTFDDIESPSSRRTDSVSKIINKVRSNFAGSTLTGNITVTITQVASFPTAIAEVGVKPTIKALKNVASKGIKEVESRTPLLRYRENASEFTYEAGSSFTQNRVVKAFANMISAMDVRTVRTLEYAAKYAIDDEIASGKLEVEKNSDEYWNKVTDKFNDIIRRTQPNYTTLERPELLKSTNAALRTFFMFKTQPVQNYGILFDATAEFIARCRTERKNKTQENTEARKESGRKLARAITSNLSSQLVYSLMKAFGLLLYHNPGDMWKDEDDDGVKEFQADELAKYLADIMLSSEAGMILGGQELYEFIASMITGDTYYGLEDSLTGMVNDITDAVTGLQTAIEGYADAKTDEDKEKNGIKTGYEARLLATTIAAMAKGIPVRNIYKPINSIVGYAQDAIDAAKTGIFKPYSGKGFLYSDTSDVESQSDRIIDAYYEGDDEEYERLKQQAIDKKIANYEKKKAKGNEDVKEFDSEEDRDEYYTDSEESDIKSAIAEKYIAGSISREDAVKFLTNEVEGEDGEAYTEADAYWDIDKWDYRREHGSADDYDKYAEIKVAITDGSISKATYTRYLENGVDAKTIKTAISNWYHKWMKENGTNADMNAKVLTAYQLLGYDRTECNKDIQAWIKKNL